MSILRTMIASAMIAGSALIARNAVAQDLSAAVKSALTTDFAARNGAVIGRGPASQNTITVGNDRITGFVWDSYNMTDNVEEERDYGIFINSDKREFICGKIDLALSYQRWMFPEQEEDMVELQCRYSGKINAQATFSERLTDGFKDQHMIYASAGKSISAGNFCITPSVSSAFLDDYFDETGMAHVTPGISIGTKVQGINIDASFNYQIGFEMPTQGYAAISISKRL